MRPSDSVVYLWNNPEINASVSTYVAYCFSQILGYSATGKYTGTGNDSGRFIYTGFRPRLIITKAYSSNSNNNSGWNVRDTSRDTFNEASEVIAFQNDDPTLDNSHTGIDILSNGFKLKNDTNGQSNYSGWDYIYYAVAENPFKSARARWHSTNWTLDTSLKPSGVYYCLYIYTTHEVYGTRKTNISILDHMVTSLGS